MIQPGQHVYDIGARVRVFLGKYGGEESREGLDRVVRVYGAVRFGAHSYLESVQIGHPAPFLQERYGAREKLPRLRMQVYQVIR